MPSSDNREEINIWLAYSDLFSAVFIITIALLFIQLLPHDEGDELKRRREVQWGMTQRLFEEIHSKGYLSEPQILEDINRRFHERAQGALVRFADTDGNEMVVLYSPEGEEQRITFGSQVLFDNEGIYRNKIKPEGVTLLQSIGSIILAQGARFSEIRVIGHTDVKPPRDGDSLDYNWVLSSERAIAVVTELLTDPEISKALPLNIKEDYERYKRGKISLNFPPNRISAIGRGEFEPFGSIGSEQWNTRKSRIYDSWNNEDLMKQNRRIEIILRSVPVMVSSDKGSVVR
jgi:flagellar motor protein MotB